MADPTKTPADTSRGRIDAQIDRDHDIALRANGLIDHDVEFAEAAAADASEIQRCVDLDHAAAQETGTEEAGDAFLAKLAAEDPHAGETDEQRCERERLEYWEAHEETERVTTPASQVAEHGNSSWDEAHGFAGVTDAANAEAQEVVARFQHENPGAATDDLQVWDSAGVTVFDDSWTDAGEDGLE